MQYSVLLISALSGLACAYTQPDTSQPPSGNPITNPVNAVVPEGKAYTITWNPSTQGKVSLLLVKGPSTNVVYFDTIADSIDNTGSFSWTPKTSYPTTSDNTGYGIQLIVEGTGQYQYSTQFGLSADPDAPASSSTDGSASSTTSFGAVETAPPNSSAEGTAVCGAEDECHSTTVATTVTSVDNCTTTTSDEHSKTRTREHATAATGTNNVTSPVLTPTVPMSVPASLATVTASAGNAGPIFSTSVVAVSGGAGSPSGSASASHSISTGAAMVGAKLSGAAAALAGLVGYMAL